jgi:imidazolonepropionase
MQKHFSVKPKPNLLLIGPFKQLLTMDGLTPQGHLRDEELRVIKDAGIVVHEGAIVTIGNFKELRSQGYACEEIDYPAVALPGFIDSHTHLCFAGSRCEEYAACLEGATYEGATYQVMVGSKGGIRSTMQATRAATKEELVKLLLERTSSLLRRGVTTAEVKSGYGLNVTDEIKMLEAIQEAAHKQPLTLIPTCFAAHQRPPEFDSANEYLPYLIQDLLPNVLKLNLAQRVDISVNPETFSVDQARNYLKAASALGFATIVHADQFERGGAALAAEVKALSADHLCASNGYDFDMLKASGVIPIVLPGATLGLGKPFAPAHAMLDSGLPLAIASDWNPGSAPMGNLLLQAALLSVAEKLTMAETLAGITVRAARALQLNDRGFLAHTMRADLVVFPCHDYREILYQQGSLVPSDLFVQGSRYSMELS